jgi:transcriptional regulator with XRE-family HTH domain
MPPTPTEFGRRLKQVRELRGQTQAELAERAGLTPVQISHFETGVKPSASAVTLVKLADALSVTIDYLLGRTNEMQTVGGPAAVVLRNLGEASSQTIETVAEIAKSLAQKDKKGD